MKKIKLLCVIIAISLSLVTVAYASDIPPIPEYQTTAKPTPAVENSSINNVEKDVQHSLASEYCDYDGLVKTASYVIDGDVWTVVEQIGVKLTNEDFPEDFTGYELVYQETFPPEIQPKAAYTSRRLENTRTYLRNNYLVASVTEECIVWYYTTGLVHLYSYSLSKNVASGYDASSFLYGTVINTDGSVSYTNGYKFAVRNGTYISIHDLNFIVTPSYYKFY